MAHRNPHNNKNYLVSKHRNASKISERFEGTDSELPWSEIEKEDSKNIVKNSPLEEKIKPSTQEREI